MSNELSDTVFLSLFYWGLSVLVLRMIIYERRQQLYLFSSVYLAVSVGKASVHWFKDAAHECHVETKIA